ncbi:MAG: hypothetical protein GWN96_09075 [candidate division Zixibacteria bacterium]|nr:hypothetical protein [candidate division Zixibacteria bacterium]
MSNDADRKKAYKIYGEALRDGTLARADKCEHCNKSDTAIYGHHEDYNKPIDVIWLCGSCHRKCHTMKKYGDADRLPKNAQKIGENDFSFAYIQEILSFNRGDLIEYFSKNEIDFFSDGYDFFTTKDGFGEFLVSLTKRNYDD